ncbi:MAG: hypothetical protein ABFS45_21575 [Pseudomonadota bacterium]
MEILKGALLITAIFTITSGCATRPESITPSHVSHERYVGNDCPTLEAKKNEAIIELMKSAELQDNDADADAVGVFLIGVPFSQLSGDHEAEVAKWKGTIDAIETVQIINDCTFDPYVFIMKETDTEEESFELH